MSNSNDYIRAQKDTNKMFTETLLFTTEKKTEITLVSIKSGKDKLIVSFSYIQ